MRAVNAAWRALDGDGIGQYEGAEAARTAALDAMTAYAVDLLGSGWLTRATFAFDGSVYPSGFVLEQGRTSQAALPVGLRYDAKDKAVVPAKRTDEGKAIAAEFDRLSFAYPRILGLGGIVSGSKGERRYFTGWSFHAFGGDLFATLSVDDLDERDQQRHLDEGWCWERVRLSVFHAAREAHEERAA